MKFPNFTTLAFLVLLSTAMLVLGLYLLTKFYTLLRQQIRNELLRRNIVVWMIAVCLTSSVSPFSKEFYRAIDTHAILRYYCIELAATTVGVLMVFNISWAISKYLQRKNMPFQQRMGIMLFTIIVSTITIGIPMGYLANNGSFKQIEYNILFNFYTACICGLVYVTMSFVELARSKKLSEKELEVSRLRELKTKAELDALHSKINPHFLYNALNSIADLSITDGKKARKMTVALADLFRYSINYSNHNYSTIKEELEMTEVYLEIEKIRFEDKLNYSISSPHDVSHYLVPRFMLQPIVENAVKHGLKATGKMTEIDIEVKDGNGNLEILVRDNGPAFPDELTPGYGVKSIYDKLDLLFPNEYEIHFANQPTKRVSIQIHKLIKNEPTV
jgi:two-component system, LytTR family, sensor kinase